MGIKNIVTGHLANISTYTSSGDITALTVTGNISSTGGYLLGNGVFLSGIPASYGNSNVAAYLPTYTGAITSLTGNVTTTGNINGAYVFGNGAGLTGLNPGIAITNGTSNVGIPTANGAINFNYAGLSAGSISANSISFGTGSGVNQGANAVALGSGSGVGQQTGAVAIGQNAGQNSQGVNAVAIGALAGTASQPTNSIIINASGSAFNGVNAGLYINPVRNDLSNVAQQLNFNATTNEITYSPSFQTTLGAGTYAGNVSTTGNVVAGKVITDTISSAGTVLTIDPLNDGSASTGNVVVLGNLQVQGNLTYNATTTAATGNLVWQAANNASSASLANGGGLAVGPAGNSYASLLYNSTNNLWNTNIPLTVNGNVTGNTFIGTNLTVSSNVTAGGNVAGTYFLGNGSFLQGVSAIYISNGTSNVGIPTTNGAITFNVGGSPAGAINTTSTSLGFQAGSISQGNYGVSIGYQSGLISQGANGVAVGSQAGYTNQSVGGVAIGSLAGLNTQGINSVAIGTGAGIANQNTRSVAIGTGAGANAQAVDSVAIGTNSGNSNQGASGIAIGVSAGQITQGTQSIAIGQSAGTTTQGSQSIAIGLSAASATQGIRSIAIGQLAGNNTQGTTAVAIGYNAGLTSQGANSIAIGQNAGTTALGADSIAIGTSAGLNSGVHSVSIGAYAGQTGQVADGVAIGYQAGQTGQGSAATAIGFGAGQITQGNYTVALGHNAGTTTQGQSAIAIGSGAGINNQGSKAIAIGDTAGGTNQGQNAIAIGYYAGNSSQASNSIVINASGLEKNNSVSGSLYILPVRQTVNTSNTGTNPVQAMYYDPTTSEASYSATNMYSGVFASLSGGGIGTNAFGSAIQLAGSTTLPSTTAPAGTKMNFYVQSGTTDSPTTLYAYTSGGGFIYCGTTSFNSIQLFVGETLELVSRGTHEWDVTGGTAGLRLQGYRTNNAVSAPVRASLGPQTPHDTWCYLDNFGVRYGTDGKVYWKMTDGSTVSWIGGGWIEELDGGVISSTFVNNSNATVRPTESEIANMRGLLLSQAGSMLQYVMSQNTSTGGTYRITVVKSNENNTAAIILERLY